MMIDLTHKHKPKTGRANSQMVHPVFCRWNDETNCYHHTASRLMHGMTCLCLMEALPPKLSHIKESEGGPCTNNFRSFRFFSLQVLFQFRSLPHASADLPCRAFNLLENGWIFESSVVNPTIKHPSNQLGVTLHHPIGNHLWPWVRSMISSHGSSTIFRCQWPIFQS